MPDIIQDIIPDVVPAIMSNILPDIIFVSQVAKLVRLLKHKLRPKDAYFKAQDFDVLLSAPKEELHQFLIGLYGDYFFLPQCMRLRKFCGVPTLSNATIRIRFLFI